MLRPTAPRFDPREFADPPRFCAPIHAWNWNGPVTREKTDAQLEEMARLGVRAMYIIPEPKGFRPTTFATLMEPDYLTPAYFDEYRHAMEKAVELGMKCWLYDEGGWPSGGACGKVLREYPDLARRRLGTREIPYAAGSRYAKTDADTAAAFIGTEQMIAEGYVFPEDCTVTEYYSHVQLFEGVGIPDYPDLLLPESTQRFLEMTHDQYEPSLKELFGDSITAVFTDEPNAPRPVPMRQELLDAYEAEYGVSILSALPAMAGKCAPTHEQGQRIADWYDLCSRWFCEHYLLAEKKWCNEHGMAFTGHMDKDDEPGCLRISGNFHYLRALRCLDIPGIDVIWRQVWPGTYRRDEGMPAVSVNGFFPRHASSAAYQNGNRWAMTESFGVYGAGLTYDAMRYVTNFQAIRGVSLMNPMLFAYHRRGTLRTGELPNFDGVQPYYAYLPEYNRFASRVTYLTTLGDRVCDTALYYPARDISVDAAAPYEPHTPGSAAERYECLGNAMEDTGIDFDVIDDDFLRDAQLTGGALCMGLARYTCICVPDCEYLPQASKDALARFAAAGGQVYYGSVPADRAAAELRTGYRGIRLMKRVSDAGELLLIFNENPEAAEIRLHMDGEHVYLLDPGPGTITRAGSEITLTLPCGALTGVYASAEALPCGAPFEPTQSCTLSGPFTFRRVRQFRLGESDMEAFDLDEAPRAAALGDWREAAGRDFSGTAVYETVFSRPEGVGDRFILDLGDVRHACEVTLNGRALGARIAPPFRYVLPASYLAEENRLTIRVTNTSANEYRYTKVFDRWPSWMIAGYVKYETVFDEDSLESGLLGPVEVRW